MNRMVFPALLLMVAVFSSCEPEGGWPWVRNMYDSPGPQTQEDAWEPPEGSFPATGVFPVERGRDLPGGGRHTRKAMERGEILFERYCMVCHGSDGTGKEMTEDYLTPDLTESDYIDLLDDELYEVIMEGGLNMPSYGDALTEQESWFVIDYLRILQKAHGN